MGTENGGPQGPELVLTPSERQWQEVLAGWSVLKESGAVGTLQDILWNIGQEQKSATLRVSIGSSLPDEIEERTGRYFELRGARVTAPEERDADPQVGLHLLYNQFDLIPLSRNRFVRLEREQQVDHISAIVLPESGLLLYHEHFILNPQGVASRVRSNELPLSAIEWRLPGVVENHLHDVYNSHKATK